MHIAVKQRFSGCRPACQDQVSNLLIGSNPRRAEWFSMINSIEVRAYSAEKRTMENRRTAFKICDKTEWN
jgi:hypothetical protein